MQLIQESLKIQYNIKINSFQASSYLLLYMDLVLLCCVGQKGDAEDGGMGWSVVPSSATLHPFMNLENRES